MADFLGLKAYIDKMHGEWGTPSCDVAVFYKGEAVYRYMVGHADADKTRPVDRDTLYWMYSCSKPITVTAAMQLVEQGKLELDAPVARYLPEYADAFYLADGVPHKVGDTMRVRHLFTMSAGLNYNLIADGILWAQEEYGGNATTRELAAAFIRTPLDFAPGDRFQYSLCHDVLAAIVEVVSGQRYGDYLRENLFAPLGMENTGFFPTAAQRDRFADQYTVDAQSGAHTLQPRFTIPFRLSAQHESGGAGLFSCTDDYARFAIAMTNGGISPDGVRILRPETVDLIRTPQLSSVVSNDTFTGAFACGSGYDYGLGVRVLTDKSNGQRSSLGEFGWDSAGGSYVLMDPDAGVTVVYNQHVRGWSAAHHYMHVPLRDSVYEALGL